MNLPIIPMLGGAAVGYFASSKEDAMRNALIGAGAVFLLENFLGVKLPGSAMATLPAGEEAVAEDMPDSGSESVPNVEEQHPNTAILAGHDYFPIGSQANLARPHLTYTNRAITIVRKMPNGSWLTQPVGEEYFTSVVRMEQEGIDIATIIGPDGKTLWAKGQSAPLASYASN